MSAELGNTHEPVGWHGNRNLIVPPDIVPLRRVSPIRKKPRTPCRLSDEGTPVGRAGDREWFSDHVFVDPATRDLRSACGTSFTAHASCVIGLLILLAGPTPTTPVRVTAPFRMPAYVAVLGGGGAGSPAPVTASPAAAPAEKPAKPEPITKTRPTPTPRRDQVPEATAPEAEQFEEPAVDAAETVDASGTATDDVSKEATGSGGGGTGDGGNGTGSGGGSGQGVGSGTSGVGITPGPYRIGQGIEPPRKIKHVAPVYPAAALTARAFGTVLIEATVDVDGRVTDAKVIHSIAALDQAALDAVRQWEFAPSRLNGIPVAVIVTVLVQFAIH